MMTDGCSIRTLAELLKPEERDSEEDEELDVQPSPYATPGCIGATVRGEDSGAERRGGGQCDGGGGAIWKKEEVSEQQQYEYSDPRPQPEYEIVYKQAVSAEDVFLGMSLKTPTTASCEDLVVKIKLPNTDFTDVELDVTETFLDCRTPKFRLGLHLPHKVDNKLSRARWQSEAEVLEVTLRMQREYDFLNK